MGQFWHQQQAALLMYALHVDINNETSIRIFVQLHIYPVPDYLKFLLSGLFPGFRDELGCKFPPRIIRSSSHSSCVLALAFNLEHFGSKGDISRSGKPGSVIYFVPFGGHSEPFDSLLLSFLPLRKRFRILETIPCAGRGMLLSPFMRCLPTHLAIAILLCL